MTRTGKLVQDTRKKRILKVECANSTVIIIGANDNIANILEGGALVDGKAPMQLRCIHEIDWVEGEINLISKKKLFPPVLNEEVA